MKIKASRSSLHGHIQVPGSKSHTIRALVLASLADGLSHIKNPLLSEDCINTSKAIPLLGAEVSFGDNTWTVNGAGKNIHLPVDVINVGNSGSLLYFLSPIASTFEGTSIFTGDASIRKRPVSHVADVLNQAGADAFCSIPGSECCPLVIRGKISTDRKIVTKGELSQYISGLMMAATRLSGTLEIELTNPKETPYLTMTQKWLESLGVEANISDDFKHISVKGPHEIKGFERTIPSDWEGVAFPLIASLVSDSEIIIDNVDSSGTQGDCAIVDVLKSVGADIEWDKEKNTLKVKGGKKLTTKNLPSGELHVNLSGYPDAVCALAAISCFIEGTVYLEDLGVCRKKETDRIKVLKSELTKLGACVEEGEDFLIIRGCREKLHGGKVESYDDHRIAMSFACLAAGLPEGESVEISNAECASVSFPGFYDAMRKIGAKFIDA